jgi:hypothetical protein
MVDMNLTIKKSTPRHSCRKLPLKVIAQFVNAETESL